MANQTILDLPTRKLLPFIGVLAEAGVTAAAADAVQADKNGRLAKIMAELNGEVSAETIRITADATAEGLIADAKAKFEEAGIPFTYFDNDVLTIIERDLELVKGKALQVLTRNFGCYWKTQEGRSLQQGQGFDGNAAAFLVWVVQTKRMGWSVSIANSDDRLFPGDGYRYAPYFGRGGSLREFYLEDVGDEWSDDYLLVAFRAI